MGLRRNHDRQISQHRNSPSSLDSSRYYRYHDLGVSADDIAREDGVSALTIRESIKRVTLYRAEFSPPEVLASQAKTVIGVAELEREMLAKALQAKTVREIQGEDGEITTETIEDFATQLQASEIITRKVEVIQPKVVKGGVNVQTNVGVGVAATPAAVAPGRGFTVEERLRELTAKRQGQLPAAPAEQIVSPVLAAPIEAFDAEAELIHGEG